MVVGEMVGSEVGMLTYVVITRTYMAILSVGVVACAFSDRQLSEKTCGNSGSGADGIFSAFYPCCTLRCE